MLPFIVLLIWLFGVCWRAVRSMQILQIEEYENNRYLRWLFVPKLRLLDARAALILAGGALVGWGLSWLPALSGLPTFEGVLAVASLASIWPPRPKEVKKPLVLTGRSVALMAAACLVIAALLGAAWNLSGQDLLRVTPAALVLYQLAPLSLVIGNLLLWPVQWGLKQRIQNNAADLLRHKKARVIAITGSYGKTSTKEFIYHILKTRYSVIKTPQSYNTPLGISGVILEQFKDDADYDYFVVEMGAYYPGNIGQLCRIAPPQVGVLTAIGPMHLERFGSIANTLKTKLELMQALPPEGTAIFNGDYDMLRQAQASISVAHKLITAVEHPQPGDALTVTDIQTSAEGLRFTVHHSPSGQSEAFETRLLGLHNVSNILLAAAVGLEAGLSLGEIAAAVQLLEPVPHRLNASRTANGVTIIDDSYNSNPEGAAQALKALSLFSGGQKVLVTPGMVELGPVEIQAHQTLGQQAAAICDHVITVGKDARVQALIAGLKQGGLAPSRIHQAETLKEATEHLWRIVLPGDAVLFLNDLPDTYGQ